MMRRILLIILTFTFVSAWAADPYELMLRKMEELRQADMERRETFLYPGGERFINNASKNDVIALRWFAAAGDIDTQAVLGDIYAKGVVEPQNMQSAIYWYGKAAEYGNTYAQYMMGLNYQLGWSGPADAEMASHWFREAEQNGPNADAQRRVAQFFNDQENALYNFAEAFRWFERAAKNNDVEAQLNLADWYLNGDKVGRNILNAIKWYGKAAAQKDPYAQYSLGLIYLNGDEIIPIDYTAAVQWIERAAWQNYNAAQYTLGRMYSLGIGVPASNMQAYAWYTMADKFNNPAVKRDIGRVTEKMSIEEIAQAVTLAHSYELKVASW
jgi:hypothetical protein